MAKLLELMPNAQLIASIAGANYLKNITNRCDLDIHKVKDGEVLDLGGLSLTFLSAPNLHWPDSMFTWVKEANTLFTCDFLSNWLNLALSSLTSSTGYPVTLTTLAGLFLALARSWPLAWFCGPYRTTAACCCGRNTSGVTAICF